MEKVKFAVLGLGNRGTVYASMQLRYPDEMEVTAIADTRPVRLEAINEKLHLPQERIFSGAEELLAQPKLADVMVIATQDAQHKDHAIAAMKKGYDLVLEKPISNHLEDVMEVVKAAETLGRTVIVCHVLRYTPFYKKVKELIDSGVIGKVENIEASECVGYYHYAHSYVRGNWHKLDDSSPMILAKCCHDMDLMLWLTGKHCLKLTSFGSLDYFTAENCPEGAKERCTDGCTVDCPFNAPKFYFSRIPNWPSNILHPQPTEENLLPILQTGNYGRCVYKMDNDVVDHQSVNMLLEDGVTVSFTMSAFNNLQTRYIHVMGTKGDIRGTVHDRKLTVSIYGKEPYEIDLNTIATNFTGHGGGDAGLIHDVIRYFRGDEFDSSSITTIGRSAESHVVCFAAEESRLNGGQTVDVPAFAAKNAAL